MAVRERQRYLAEITELKVALRDAMGKGDKEARIGRLHLELDHVRWGGVKGFLGAGGYAVAGWQATGLDAWRREALPCWHACWCACPLSVQCRADST